MIFPTSPEVTLTPIRFAARRISPAQADAALLTPEPLRTPLPLSDFNHFSGSLAVSFPGCDPCINWKCKCAPLTKLPVAPDFPIS